MKKQYAQVIVGLKASQVDRIFSYRIPPTLEDRIQEGMVAEVPFGNGNQRCRGFIIGITDTVDYDPSKAKDLIRLLSEEPVFTREQLQLAQWMQKQYDAPLGSCLSLFVPKQATKTLRESVYYVLGENPEEVRGAAQKKVLEYLKKAETPVSLTELRKETGITSASFKTLENKKWIIRYEKPEGQPPAHLVYKDTARTLNFEQQQAYDAVTESLIAGEHRTFLLKGITGSGKTEIYMQLIQQVLDRGQQAIVLVPEISLTPQLIDVFTNRFGERIGVTHSRLTDHERAVLWNQAKEGRLQVMIGPRSALFAPFEKLGLIILDEEHESTYKSEQSPRYHARETAVQYGRRLGIPVLLGSATPSIESYYLAEQGEYQLLTLTQRAVAGAELPEISIVDMRQEMALGNMSIFCGALMEAIRERLERQEQVILFLNRKGYSTFVSCRSCGFVLKCPNCYLPYTWHKDQNKLICHHCGKEVDPVQACPGCGSPYIRHFGAGTQRVEEEIRKCFPQARVLRMDTSVVRGEETYQNVYEQFRDRKADILIGTQMIAKGFDFPYVTLVGVLAADMILYSDDYHSPERTFQLLTQVAGRAGRAGRAGEVIIQTYSPDHYCIQDAARHDFESFYKSELTARRLTGCPPFTHILQFLITDTDEERLLQQTQSFHRLLCRYGRDRGFLILNPAPASLERINNVFRRRIIVKLDDRERLAAFGKYCREKFLTKFRQAKIQMDIDPVFMV